MKSANPSPGVSCPPVVEADALPLYSPTDPRVRIGCVEINRKTIIQSPAFWFLLGVGAAFGGYVLIQYVGKKRRD